jgi:hypothetical protein
MATLAPGNTLLGDLVAAAFDDASLLSADPKEVSRLAAHAVTRVLMREWATASPAQRRPRRAGTTDAWTRFLFKCAGPSVALLERAADAIGRGVIGGRAGW